MNDNTASCNALACDVAGGIRNSGEGGATLTLEKSAVKNNTAAATGGCLDESCIAGGISDASGVAGSVTLLKRNAVIHNTPTNCNFIDPGCAP